MAAKFCFKYERKWDNCIGSFQSEDGEEYTVKMYSAVISQNRILTLEWEEVARYCGSTIIIDATPYIHVGKYDGQERTPMRMKPVDRKLDHFTTEIKQLSLDMGKLYQTGNFSDVVLTDGSKELHVHKVILSVRSPVFAKMFLHPMKENRENRIIISDITYEVLSQLLHFMYTGDVMIKNYHMARDLYVAADKYDVKNLKVLCSQSLEEYMPEDLNYGLDTLVFAELYSDVALKKAALNFISKRYSRVKSSKSWNIFAKEHQDLTNDILRFVIDKKEKLNLKLAC